MKDKTKLVISAFITIAVISTCLSAVYAVDLYAQVLERDIDEPDLPLNGSATTISVPPEVNIDIDPLEPLPANGTVTISMDGAVDTNMNDIPPEGVTVIISSDSVTVTNHGVSIVDDAAGE